MQKVLCDVNVVLDFLLKREPFFEDSKLIFKKIAKNEFHGFLSGISIDTIFYLLKKSNKNNEESREIISELLEIFDIATIDKELIKDALMRNIRDFEDAIQYESAMQEECEIIFTRNEKDFPQSTTIKIISPKNFLHSK